jgi:hypothetical protein
MGGSPTTTTKTNQTQQTNPYGPANSGIDAITGQIAGLIPNTGINPTESSAFGTLMNNANNGNPYAGQIGGLATNLLNGGGANNQTPMLNQAYQDYMKRLSPTANGDLNNPASNPALQGYLGTIGNDVQNRVNSMFAGAGRDLSGLNQQSLARGITEGQAPILYDAYNQGVNNQMNAAGNLYGAGNSTASALTGMNQTALGNQQAGIGVSGSALQANDSAANQMLAIQQQMRGLQPGNIAQLQSLLLPIASSFGQTTGSGTSTSQQDLPLWMQILGGVSSAASTIGKFIPTSWGMPTTGK